MSSGSGLPIWHRDNKSAFRRAVKGCSLLRWKSRTSSSVLHSQNGTRLDRDLLSGRSTARKRNVPPPSNNFLPCQSCNIRVVHHPRDPTPPKDQFHVAIGSPASPSSPHWMTTKSGSYVSLMRSIIGHIRANVRLEAPDFRGIDRANGSNAESSGLGRLESAEAGKKPGDV